MKFLKYTALAVTAVLGWAYFMPQYFPFEMLIKTFFGSYNTKGYK